VAPAFAQASPVFGGDSMWVQLLPFSILVVLTLIPALRVLRKLEMSRWWALFALWPLAGPMIILWVASYGMWAGVTFAVLSVVGMMAPLIGLWLSYLQAPLPAASATMIAKAIQKNKKVAMGANSPRLY
jgi:uncharacterized membrane protein YhaH (DUF805 family)